MIQQLQHKHQARVKVEDCSNEYQFHQANLSNQNFVNQSNILGLNWQIFHLQNKIKMRESIIDQQGKQICRLESNTLGVSNTQTEE